MTTSRQSRQENADLLQTFGRVLLPLIKAYKGRLIKSIGDAYLVTFHSPTDAMICSMALQDAMHGYNLNVVEEEKIHIRVAAHLGEVRVAKNDIFGEPVNVTSRIEGVTPGDEIYLSEAVYMAMNKAEVPVEEVGEKQLDGVAQTVRLYSIPRFSINRLVPEKREITETGSELVYPYGGMHYYLANDNNFNLQRLKPSQTTKLSVGLIGGFILLLLAGWYFELISFNTDNANKNDRLVKSGEVEGDKNINEGIGIVGNTDDAVSPSIDEQANQKQALTGESNQFTSEPAEQQAATINSLKINSEEINVAQEKQEMQVTDVIANAVTESKQIISNQITSKSAQAKELLDKTISSKPAEVDKNLVRESKAKPQPEKAKEKVPPPIRWDVTKAKQAYRAEKISKAEYAIIIRNLKLAYKEKITKLKSDYRDNKITKSEYSAAVKIAKQEYNGG